MADRKTGGISGPGAQYVNEMYRELGKKPMTIEEFAKKIRSQKLPENTKYEKTPKGVKENTNKLSNKILKSFGMK